MNEKYYRYCFFCDKWKSKEEINEVEWGQGNKTFNCNVCRKDLGDKIQIFCCPKHNNEILKVWGTLEGQNKEKVFYKECPQKQQPQQPQPKPQPKEPDKGISGGAIALIIGAVCILLAGGGVGWWWWQSKKSQSREREEGQL